MNISTPDGQAADREANLFKTAARGWWRVRRPSSKRWGFSAWRPGGSFPARRQVYGPPAPFSPNFPPSASYPRRAWAKTPRRPRPPRGIVAAAELTRDHTVLEVGPGLGVLTELIAEQAGRVIAVELDDRLIPSCTSASPTSRT